MQNRPLLLLDIDGVLNPFAAPTCPEGYVEYALFPEDDRPVRLSNAHAEWLVDIGSLFEIVWASAWGNEAYVRIGRILGLPELDWVPLRPIPFEPSAKLSAIEAYVGARAAAWVDDALLPEAWVWATTRAEPTLLVPVDPEVGLIREHVDALVAWANDLRRQRCDVGPAT